MCIWIVRKFACRCLKVCIWIVVKCFCTTSMHIIWKYAWQTLPDPKIDCQRVYYVLFIMKLWEGWCVTLWIHVLNAMQFGAPFACLRKLHGLWGFTQRTVYRLEINWTKVLVTESLLAQAWVKCFVDARDENGNTAAETVRGHYADDHMLDVIGHVRNNMPAPPPRPVCAVV